MSNQTVCLLAAFLAIQAPRIGYGQEPKVKAYYKPPIVIPLTFTVDQKGEISVSVKGEIVTPFGTFGIGAGVGSARNQDHTYVIVRKDDQEFVYPIGTTGKLRMRVEGGIEIELGLADGFPNAFLVDVKSYHGTFELDFVHEPREHVLARIKQSNSIWYELSTSEVFVLNKSSDRFYSLDSFEKIYFFRQPDRNRVWVTMLIDSNSFGKVEFSCTGQQALEALWLRQCLKSLCPEKVVDLEVSKEFESGAAVVFRGGSVFLQFQSEDSLMPPLFLPDTVLQSLSSGEQAGEIVAHLNRPTVRVERVKQHYNGTERDQYRLESRISYLCSGFADEPRGDLVAAANEQLKKDDLP